MKFEQPPPQEQEKEMTKQERVALGKELAAQAEVFPFQGIEESVLETIRQEENEYPGLTTPIDELMARCATHGMKIVLGDHPESGNVFLLPADSDNIAEDTLPLKHLKIGEGMDPRLKALILAKRALGRPKS